MQANSQPNPMQASNNNPLSFDGLDPEQQQAVLRECIEQDSLDPADSAFGCGIESIELPTGEILRYVNTGDTYDSTVVQVGSQEPRISSWGDEYEQAKREHQEDTGEQRCGYCSEWVEASEPYCSCGQYVENPNRKGYFMVSWGYPGCLSETENPMISNDPDDLAEELEALLDGAPGMEQDSAWDLLAEQLRKWKEAANKALEAEQWESLPSFRFSPEGNAAIYSILPE